MLSEKEKDRCFAWHERPFMSETAVKNLRVQLIELGLLVPTDGTYRPSRPQGRFKIKTKGETDASAIEQNQN